MHKRSFIPIVLLLSLSIEAGAAPPEQGTYDNSMVLAPLYVDYTLVSPEKFAQDAAALKTSIGSAPHVLLGFSAFLRVEYPDIPITKTIDDADMAPALAEADLIVERARTNGLITHISIVSGFFHSHNALRYSAVNQDVRNAQWFSDGWIADPKDLTDAGNLPGTIWVTPSRYAQPLRSRVEEGARIVGRHLAGLMARYPDTFMTVSGDGETELSYIRNLSEDGTKRTGSGEIIYADYSPFMVEEFRDWLRNARYAGDLTPATDDNQDGRSFNRDFAQSFTTWDLRYYNNSGPVPFADYVRMPEKLPSSGPYFLPGGFDAPRVERDDDPYWIAWVEFRRYAVKNWIRDFVTTIMTSPDPVTGFQIPASRFYTHQIPGDMIFGESDNLRLRMSASPIDTAILDPIASTGVTAFNGFDGSRHSKTATPALYSALFMTSDHWGIMEYNPSLTANVNVEPSKDMRYYMNELRILYNFRPHVIIPFAWTDYPAHKIFSIKGTTFERALKQFVQEVGRTPWFSWRAVLK